MSTSRIRRRIRLGKHSNGMIMTPEEFDAVTEVDERYVYELIHGVLIVSPPPGEGERDPNGELEYLLRRHKEDHPQGSLLDKTLSEQYVHLPDSRRRADRVLWIGLGRVPDPAKDVPTIVVEFVSKRKRDRVRDFEEKRREYLDLGVHEYWIIDRFSRSMTVVRRTPAGPEEVVVPESGTYQSPSLPGFELPLSRLLSLADHWGEGGRPRPPR
ncbi:Uma2 family endonuclease [Tautonia plasticadhaerens]|uniref:Putative restriction endonuclease domain-containing protein n=1 Tax=Tautonia plasticadhaerens TaxID=2527974 RepID=A0A518GWH4_9BACT|nr:Uma2 family endonuclease [Tautonia plasticadhaerens]QDV32934.1 hypothetical protein ElP_07760 [Tautonia plasticadhaerens]